MDFATTWRFIMFSSYENLGKKWVLLLHSVEVITVMHMQIWHLFLNAIDNNRSTEPSDHCSKWKANDDLKYEQND